MAKPLGCAERKPQCLSLLFFLNRHFHSSYSLHLSFHAHLYVFHVCGDRNDALYQKKYLINKRNKRYVAIYL